MAAVPIAAPDEAARLCRAEARQLEFIDESRLAERVAASAGIRLWVERVPGATASPVAARRRERELSRPVDPQAGPGVRVVLLRYADGPADLVVVAHRAVAEPDSVLRALLTPPAPAARLDSGLLERLQAGLARLDRIEPPDWGLGRPGARTSGVHRFVLGPARGEGSPDVLLAGALGLVLARCTGTDRVAIGIDPLRTAEFECMAGSTVAAYLAQVRERFEQPGTEPALVGLAVGPTRPFLAPVHPLSIWVENSAGVLQGGCWFRYDAADPAVVRWFTGMLGAAFRSLAAAGPDESTDELALFDADQVRQLAELGGQGLAVPGDSAARRIEELVSAQAATRPDAIALCFEQHRLTYRELDERSNRAAHALRAAGVRTQDLVGVCLQRSLDLVVMLLAVLKAGAAYVPMDAGYPAERLSYTASDAGLSVVITDSADFPAPAGVMLLAPDALQAADRPATAPEPAGGVENPAYVIYTSGSTGRPKGVLVPHRNVANLLAATADDFGLGGNDVWTLFHSSAFDFSVWEIWGCLSTGGRLVVVPTWTARDPQRLAELLAAEQVSVLNQTPSAFGQLSQVDRQCRLPDSLRLVIFGGEPLDTRPLLDWFDRHPESRCRLVNMFGITETTVHVTAQTLGRHEALTGSRSVGNPLPGWYLSVRDAHGRPVPPGVPGEIYVGGAGVATGYLGRPELTVQRFLVIPQVDPAGRWYRSGDRGRLLPDGRLEHLGRLDNQVKLRGFRIELDEIRSRLLDAPGVGAAAVLLRQDGTDSATARLDAYLVLSGGASVEQVREHAARFLPEHMLPSTFTVLPALPLTANGKLDSARLPEPVSSVSHGESAPAEVGDGADLETRLHAVWQQVFGFRVGFDDDFFTLGGNSLLGVQLFAAMRSAGLPTPPLRQLYLNRTVRGLAEVLRVMDEEASAC